MESQQDCTSLPGLLTLWPKDQPHGISPVIASTDESLPARRQALGGVVLLLGHRPQGHLAHEGVAPLIFLVGPCLHSNSTAVVGNCPQNHGIVDENT